MAAALVIACEALALASARAGGDSLLSCDDDGAVDGTVISDDVDDNGALDGGVVETVESPGVAAAVGLFFTGLIAFPPCGLELLRLFLLLLWLLGADSAAFSFFGDVVNERACIFPGV